MKIKLFIMLALLAGFHQASAQGTAFTYQGRLNSSGVPADGTYDFQFILFNTDTFGFPVGPTLTNSAVLVTNGLFITTLDFGVGIFTGTNLWLDIGVRTNGGVTFSELLPRQPLRPVPYAVMANSASNLLGAVPVAQLTGTISQAQLPREVALLNANQLFTGINVFGGTVGIGTISPTVPVDIFSSDFPNMLVDGSSVYGTWVDLRNTTAGGTNWEIISTGAGNAEGAGKLLFDYGSQPGDTSGNTLTLTSGGSVGIGTTAPQSRLQVFGDVTLGGDGKLHAAGGGESLRIVRGTVGPSGRVYSGTGFSVFSPNAGVYIITFNPPFSDFPAVTAMAQSGYYVGFSGTAATNQVVLNVLGQTFTGPVLTSEPFNFIAIGVP